MIYNVFIVKKKIIHQTFAWLPVVFWLLLIFHFSSGTVPVASAVYWQDFAVKKTGHVLLFGALGLLIYRAFRINKVGKYKAAVWAVILSTFYGATDEFHQMFTQGRESKIRDVFIDGFGAFLVVWVLYYLPVHLSKKIQNMLEQFDLI